MPHSLPNIMRPPCRAILLRAACFVVLFSAITNASIPTLAAPVAVSPTVQGGLQIKSWAAFKNDRIIKQKLDYSCGAAALATLLHGYYGLAVSEESIIEITGKNAWFSFADMEKAVTHYGMKAVGLALNLEQLKQLKVPVIVFIHTREGPHFAVLRGISEDTVWIGDPATGNERYPIYRFQEKWETRKDPNFRGRILLVLPTPDTTVKIEEGFFQKLLPETHLPLRQLGTTRQGIIR